MRGHGGTEQAPSKAPRDRWVEKTPHDADELGRATRSEPGGVPSGDWFQRGSGQKSRRSIFEEDSA